MEKYVYPHKQKVTTIVKSYYRYGELVNEEVTNEIDHPGLSTLVYLIAHAPYRYHGKVEVAAQNAVNWAKEVIKILEEDEKNVPLN